MASLRKEFEDRLISEGFTLVRIERMFQGCPKFDGWFGFFGTLPGSFSWVKVTGNLNPEETDHFTLLRDGHEVLCMLRPGRPSQDGKPSYLSEKSIPIYRKSEAKRRFLSFDGVGESSFLKAWDAFGEYCVLAASAYPDEFKKAGLSKKQEEAVLSGFSGMTPYGRLRSAVPQDLMSDRAVRMASDLYGDGAVDMIRSHPYRLLDDFSGERGFSFKEVDRLALVFSGVDPMDPVRADRVLEDCVRRYVGNGGHACIDLYEAQYDGEPDHLDRMLADASSYFPKPVYDRLSLMHAFYRDGSRVRPAYDPEPGEYGEDHLWLYPRRLYDAETDIFRIILDMLSDPDKGADIDGGQFDRTCALYEVLRGFPLSSEQKEGVRTSLKSRVSVLRGIPGSGKTFTAACVLYVWKTAVGKDAYLMAPTGIASRRLKASCAEAYPDCPSGTVDYFLCTVNTDPALRKKMNGALILVDEAGMLDMEKAARLLRTFSDSHIVFLGDAEQLPSIGPGEFFRSLYTSGKVPNTILTECFRTKGGEAGIDLTASLIRQGVVYDPQDPYSMDRWGRAFSTGEVYQCFTNRAEDTVASVLYVYKSLMDQGMRAEDVMILCPSGKREDGAAAFNLAIQDAVNPETHGSMYWSGSGMLLDVKGSPVPRMWCCSKKEAGGAGRCFRIGDRAVFLENMVKKYGLVNGDTGRIAHYIEAKGEPARILFVSDAGHTALIEAEDFSCLALSYALTVHKAQGCEYRAVILAIPQGMEFWGDGFANRNLVFTGATRAREMLLLAGNLDGFNACIRRPAPRRTNRLSDRLWGWHEREEEGEEDHEIP